MKKAKKQAKSKTSSKRRVKSKTSSKRVGGKSKARKQIKAKPRTKSKKSILPKTPKLKQVAKEAAVAAGLAAVGTALSAMKPQQKGRVLDISPLRLGVYEIWIHEYADEIDRGHELAQQAQPLRA